MRGSLFCHLKRNIVNFQYFTIAKEIKFVRIEHEFMKRVRIKLFFR